MGDANKTKSQLISELETLRQRLVALEAKASAGVPEQFDHKGESELSQSDERLRHLILNLRIAQYRYVQAKDGQFYFSYFDTGYAETLEIESEKVLADPQVLFRMIHPDDRAAFDESLAECASTLKPWRLEYRYRFPSGEIRWVRGAAAPASQPNGDIYWDGLLLDITERKEAEEELRSSEQSLRTILETISHGIVEIDTEGTVTYGNPAHHKMLGFPDKQLIGTSVLDRLGSDAEREALRGFLANVAREQPAPMPYFTKSRTQNGDTIDLQVDWNYKRDEQGNLTGFISILTDITERRRAEEELRLSEERLRQATELAKLGHWIWDAVEDKCIYCSEEHARIHGVSVEEYISRSSPLDGEFPFTHPEDREKYRDACRALRNGADFEMEYRVVTPAGETRHVREIAKPVFDKTGSVIQEYGTIQDITELRKQEAQLRQSQKMEAIGTLAGGVAHDFNNLLTGIIGYTQLLLAQMQPDSPQTRDLMQIQELADRATKLIGQLLAFSRKEKIESEVLNLSTLVAKMEPMLRRLIGEDIEVVVKTSSEVRPIKADPGQLEQVLMNLIVNARDAMPKGGKLMIETADVMLDRDFGNTDEWIKAGPHVMLAVSDTGCGMDQATQARIFEPFFTTKKVGEGTGLGLSTVYGIVKQHEGYVFVYSEPGQGTSFKIYLPCVDAEEQKEVLEPKTVAVPRGSETILVAEDEKPVRTVIQRTLEKQGYTVLTAANPKEAEELFTQHEGNIALLVTDMVMPGGDGRDLYRLLTARGLRQVLYISGYTDSAASHMGLLDSNEPYLQKPFAPGALEGAVRGVLDGRI
ncbi:MAG: PAS domain S-box protein [Deltaproteobacteria bacterium]|nr:PAS domain S-box protein [Deltaproteobacteria bacterium]